MTLDAGTTLAGYRVESLLGRGGMGEVYLATHVGLGRKVALKLLAPELASDERFRARFIAESRLAASLDHPNIVPIYEAGEADGRLFLAMRYVEGADLGAILARDGRLEPGRAIGLLRGIADALDAAHERGLVHRDVKPGNILVARTSRGDEHAYLADFGLTKQLASGAGFTRSGQLVGSVDYVAPEQIEGRPIDGRADVYSLASVLYTVLAGEPPYPRETEMAILWAHVQASPPRLSGTRPELAPLDDVVARGMAKAPEERYATAGELLGAAGEAQAPNQMPTAGMTRGFLFADLRGYTGYVERHGDDAAADLLARYRRLVREVVAGSEGAEVRTEGDSFYVLFPSASRAVTAGLDIVAAAARSNAEDPSRQIRVGVGVHAGETAETTEGPVGSAVNVAARICAEADAGQVLVSDTVRGLTRTRRVASFESVGRRRLKGIAEPLLLYRAVEAASALDSSQAHPGPGRSILRGRSGRRRGRLISVAVAATAFLAVASVGLMAAVASRDGRGAGASNPAGASLATALPSGAPSLVDPTSLVLVKDMDSPGTYESEADGIRVKLDVPAGWRATDVQQHSLRLALVDRLGSQVTIVVGQPSRIFSVPCGDRNDVLEPFLENIIPAIQDNPNLEPEEGVGAGHHGGRYVVRRLVEGNPAVQTDATVIGGSNCYADGVKRVVLFTTADRTYIDVVQHERFRVLIVNVGGNDVLAVVARAPSASELDILTTKLEVMLRELRFVRA